MTHCSQPTHTYTFILTGARVDLDLEIMMNDSGIQFPKGMTSMTEFVRLLQAATLFTAFIRADIRVLLICYYVVDGLRDRVTKELTVAVMVWVGTAAKTTDFDPEWIAHAKKDVPRITSQGNICALPIYPPGMEALPSCVFCNAALPEALFFRPDRCRQPATHNLSQVLASACMTFTNGGITKGIVLHRKCNECHGSHYCSHAESKGISKTYTFFHKQPYFISSAQTIYSMDLLEYFERYLITSVGNNHSFEDLYQETFVNGYVRVLNIKDVYNNL